MCLQCVYRLVPEGYSIALVARLCGLDERAVYRLDGEAGAQLDAAIRLRRHRYGDTWTRASARRLEPGERLRVFPNGKEVR